MENEERGDWESEDEAARGYSYRRTICVVLLAYPAGMVGAGIVFLILFAPCGIPWMVLSTLLGERAAPLAVLCGGGGFASGCFIGLHLSNAPWRLLLLFLGNPSFALFAVMAATIRMNRPWEILGITPDSDSLYLVALFLGLGTLSALLGDWYAWRRAKEAGIR